MSSYKADECKAWLNSFDSRVSAIKYTLVRHYLPEIIASPDDSNFENLSEIDKKLNEIIDLISKTYPSDLI